MSIIVWGVSSGCMARKDQDKHKKEKMKEHLMMTNLVY